jgi:hypothetical protein
MRISRNRAIGAVAVVVVAGAVATQLILGNGGARSALLDRLGASFEGTSGEKALAPAGPTTAGSVGQDGSTGSGGGSSAVHGPSLDASRPDLLVIKTGSLELQVSDIDSALAAAAAKISALGGYASGSDRSGDGEAAHASVTYRVPASAWDDAVAALRGLAVKVVAEHSQTDDVTMQVVDLSARIANLQVTEKALQDIMARADKVADVLDVQTQLTTVRGQIEQATAERKHLQDQAAYSTLTAGFGLTPDPITTAQKRFDPKSEVDRAAGSLVEVLQAVATAGIWFAIVWLPILLVLGVFVLVIAVVTRRFRRASGPGPGPGIPMPPIAPTTGDAAA